MTAAPDFTDPIARDYDRRAQASFRVAARSLSRHDMLGAETHTKIGLEFGLLAIKAEAAGKRRVRFPCLEAIGIGHWLTAARGARTARHA